MTFAAFKRLWTQKRMSAAFHVEFWTSTPSLVHAAVLRVALVRVLKALCEPQRSVVGVLGDLFALYATYHVQLSEPKLKLQVDPRA